MSYKEEQKIRKRIGDIEKAIEWIGVPKDRKDKLDLAQYNSALEILKRKLSTMIRERGV